MTQQTHIQGIQFSQLDQGSHFLLWALRALARGCSNCCTMKKGFAFTFGQEAGHALLAMKSLASALGNDGNRKLMLSVPGCQKLTADELSILCLLASAQRDDQFQCQSHLTWLLAKSPSPELLNLCIGIAQAFSRHSLEIDQPSLELHAPQEIPRASFIHAVGYA